MPAQAAETRVASAGRGGAGGGGAQAKGAESEPVGGGKPARGPDVAIDEVLGSLEGVRYCRWLGEEVRKGDNYGWVGG